MSLQKTLYILICMFLCLMCGCTQDKKGEKLVDSNEGRPISNNQHKVNAIQRMPIVIPTDWINQLKQLKTEEQFGPILQQFNSFIKPDSLDGVMDITNNVKPLVKPYFANLDEEQGEEIICLLGNEEYDPLLTVFKKIDGTWYLLYKEAYRQRFEESPEVVIVNTASANKTFYCRQLYSRGSGVYCDGIQFYKLIGQKIYPCLSFPENAHLYGWENPLNQKVETNFHFEHSSNDRIFVHYNYNFFLGPVEKDDASWDSHEEQSMIKGSKTVSYTWSSNANEYVLDKKMDHNALNEAKVACIQQLGNDSLFIMAFDDEIQQAVKNNSKQKRYIKNFLKVYKNKNIQTHQ